MASLRAGGAHAAGKAEVLRQVMRLDQSGLAEDKGVLDDVFQFPDIAGVVVGDETGQGLAGQSGDLLFLQDVEMADEMIRQQRDILHPVPQGRQLHPDDIDPVIEVFPEFPLLDEFLKPPVGRGDDPDVRWDTFHSTQRFVGLFLKHPEQTYLKGR